MSDVQIPPWQTEAPTPAPAQRKAGTQMPQWAKVLFEPQWRYISVRGGRGSGKTKNFARALVMRSTIEPLRVLCTREVQLSIRESVYATIVGEIKELGLESEFEILSNEIRSKRGGVFIFRGLAAETIDSIKSLADIDIAWVEEAQSVSKKSFEMLFPTIRADNSQIWLSWNPELETDPIYELVCKPPGLPDCANLFVNFDQNPWFPKVLALEEQHMLAHDPVRHAHIWGGMPLPAVAGAIYFDEIMRMMREERIRLLSLDPLLQLYAVFDLGFNDAMTCCIVQKTSMDVRIIDFIENDRVSLQWFDTELRARGYENAIVVFPHDGRNKSLQTALSPQEVMQMYGWMVEICDNVGVENGIRLCRELMANMYIDRAKCDVLLEHMKRYARNKHGHPTHDEHSHAADAMRYVAVHANRMTSNFSGGGWGGGWGTELQYPKLITG